MTTVLLILAAVVALALLVACVGLMVEDFGIWLTFTMTGVPTALCKALGLIVVALLNQNE
jgi:hypothetical protein